MVKRIPDADKEEIKHLYFKDGLNPTEINEIFTEYSYTSIYGLTRAVERGFKGLTDYRIQMAKALGKDINAYRRGLYRKNNPKKERRPSKIEQFESRKEYELHLLGKRGFQSRREYDKHLAEERSKLPQNRELKRIINQGLKNLDKSQYWLAAETKISRGLVNLYAKGHQFPSQGNLDKILDALDMKKEKKNLENLLDED